MLVFEGKTRALEEKLLRARTRTNNKLNPHMMLSPGIEPRPLWWEASALTTEPSLLPHSFFFEFFRSSSLIGSCGSFGIASYAGCPEGHTVS